MENPVSPNGEVTLQPASSKGKKSVVQFIKFALVGVLNTLVDQAVFYVLVRFFGMGEGWAKLISYSCGVLNSYVFNSLWTFKEEHKRSAREFILFIIVNVVSYGLSVLLMHLLIHYVFADGAAANWVMSSTFLSRFVGDVDTCNKLMANVIAIPVPMIVNFVLNKLFVFKGNKEEAEVTEE